MNKNKSTNWTNNTKNCKTLIKLLEKCPKVVKMQSQCYIYRYILKKCQDNNKKNQSVLITT